MSYQSEVLADSPAGYWRFRETSGTNANDETTNNLDGTYIGSPTLGIAGPITTDGPASKGATFGSSKYVDFTPSTTHNLGNTLSLECWVKRGTPGTANDPLVGKIDSSHGYGLRFTSSNFIELINGAGQRAISSVAVSTNTAWHHIVATHNSTTAKIYLDGVDVTGTVTSRTFDDSAGSLRIARLTASNEFTGSMSEVAIYPTALSSTRVQAHYNAAVNPYVAEVLADTPVGYWRLGESSGTTATDSSGNVLNGTYVNTPTLGVSGAVSGDTAASFASASSEYVTVADNNLLDLGDTFSLECWLKTSTTSTQYLISKNLGAYQLFINGSDQKVYLNGNASSVANSSVTVTDGTFHHVVVTKSGTTRKVYVDGVDVTVLSTNNTLIDNTSALAIGAISGGAASFFNGTLDEVAIYSTALSQARVQAHYNAAVNPYVAAVLADTPVGYWRLSETSGTTAADSSGHGLTGTYVNTPTLGVTGAIINDSSTNKAVTLTPASLEYISIPDNNLIDLVSTWSVEAWIKRASTTTLTDKHYIYTKSSNQPYVWMSTTGAIAVGNSLSTAATSTVTISDTAWHHIVTTRSGSTWKIYIDGVDRTGTVTDLATEVANTQEARWGVAGNATNPDFFWNGSLDELALYSTALSQTRVQAHYAAAVLPPSSPPTAGFNSSVSGYVASFTDSSTTPSGTTITSRTWDFGDGTTSSLTNPSHTYASPGSYTVTLTVLNSAGLTDDIQHTATVSQPPTADFSYSTSGKTVTFTDASTDPDGTIATRSWAFGDAATSTSTNPSHTYASFTTYSVTLTVTDNTGHTASTTKSVALSNTPPTADFSYSSSGLTVSFTDASSDPDGTIASRSWNFGDSGTSTSTNPSHTYASAGTYSVALTVTDDGGATNTKTVSVTVATVVGSPPTANFTFSSSGLTRTFTDTSTDPDGTIATRSWNFGDSGTSTATNPSHTYAARGSYTVTLTVTDNSGNTATVQKTVSILKAQFTYVGQNLTKTFTDTSTGTVATRSWNFGDSTTSTASNPTHTYASSSTYTVTLTVTDGLGDSTSATATVYAYAPGTGLKVTVSGGQEGLDAHVDLPVNLRKTRTYTWSVRVYCEQPTGIVLSNLYLQERTGAFRTAALAGSSGVTTLNPGFTTLSGSATLGSDWESDSALVIRPARKADNSGYDSTKALFYDHLQIEFGTSVTAWEAGSSGGGLPLTPGSDGTVAQDATLDLDFNHQYRWRMRATDGTIFGDYTDWQLFQYVASPQITLLSPSITPPTNYLIEPSAEYDLTGFAGSSWTEVSRATSRNILTENQSSVETDTTGFTAWQGDEAISRTTDDSYEGGSSLLIDTTAIGGGTHGHTEHGAYTAFPATNPTAAGTYVIASAYVKAPAGTPLLIASSLRLEDNTTQMGVGMTSTSASGDWDRIESIPVTNNDQDFAASVFVGVPEGTAVQVYADALQLEESELPDGSATGFQVGNAGFDSYINTVGDGDAAFGNVSWEAVTDGSLTHALLSDYITVTDTTPWFVYGHMKSMDPGLTPTSSLGVECYDDSDVLLGTIYPQSIRSGENAAPTSHWTPYGGIIYPIGSAFGPAFPSGTTSFRVRWTPSSAGEGVVRLDAVMASPLPTTVDDADLVAVSRWYGYFDGSSEGLYATSLDPTYSWSGTTGKSRSFGQYVSRDVPQFIYMGYGHPTGLNKGSDRLIIEQLVSDGTYKRVHDTGYIPGSRTIIPVPNAILKDDYRFRITLEVTDVNEISSTTPYIYTDVNYEGPPELNILIAQAVPEKAEVELVFDGTQLGILEFGGIEIAVGDKDNVVDLITDPNQSIYRYPYPISGQATDYYVRQVQNVGSDQMESRWDHALVTCEYEDWWLKDIEDPYNAAMAIKVYAKDPPSVTHGVESTSYRPFGTTDRVHILGRARPQEGKLVVRLLASDRGLLEKLDQMEELRARRKTCCLLSQRPGRRRFVQVMDIEESAVQVPEYMTYELSYVEATYAENYYVREGVYTDV